MTPYYADEHVALYLGDCREVLPAIEVTADLVVTDPPYGDTSLAWDVWPERWLSAIEDSGASSLWCFGSMRMFLDRRDDFAAWRLSQDVVWEKHNGSSFLADRFRRVHEHALHFYRGPWDEIHHKPQVTNDATARTVRSKTKTPHLRPIDRTTYVSHDGGPRLMTSVIYARSMHGSAIHPTEKPVAVLDPLIRYGSAPGGLVLDPFAGGGSTLVAARDAGRRAIGIEVDERYCEATALRLSAAPLTFEEVR